MLNNKKPLFVKIPIEKLQSLALEKDLNELGKFHKDLAIELGKDNPQGNTEASAMARELLETAKAYRDKGQKGAQERS